MKIKMNYASDYETEYDVEISSLQELIQLAIDEEHRLIIERPVGTDDANEVTELTVMIYDDYIE